MTVSLIAKVEEGRASKILKENIYTLTDIIMPWCWPVLRYHSQVSALDMKFILHKQHAYPQHQKFKSIDFVTF